MAKRALLLLLLVGCGGPDPVQPPPKVTTPKITVEAAPITLKCPEGAAARREGGRTFCETPQALHGPYEARRGGQLIEEMTLTLGRREGAYKRYWMNGRPKLQGAYSEGLREGKWMMWDDRGRPLAQAVFKRGDIEKCGWGDCEVAFPPDVYCEAGDINQALGGHARAMEACFQEAVKRRPNAGGKIHVQWSIGLDGRARNVQVPKTRFDREMTDCLQRVIKEWRFPKPAGGACAVEHVFEFHQEF